MQLEAASTSGVVPISLVAKQIQLFENTDGNESEPRSLISKERRRLEKRRVRLMDTQRLLYAKHFSNYRLPTVLSSLTVSNPVLYLTRKESLTPPPSERRPLLHKKPRNSAWARLGAVKCPCHHCSSMLEPHSWLAHYIGVHLPQTHMPFAELKAPLSKHPIKAMCYLSQMADDVHLLLGVFGYRRAGLNPLKCARNTYLPEAYRQFSQHGVLLLFACRTKHALLWERKQLKDVLAVWVVTPLQGVSISLQGIVELENSPRYFAKRIKTRAMHAQVQPCREFIKTDSNAIIIDLNELLVTGTEQLNIQLHVKGEQKI